MRKEFYPDFADKFLLEGKEVGPCPLIEFGDEFLQEGGAEMPKGLCPWAWIDTLSRIA